MTFFLIVKERIDTLHITLNFNCIDLHLSLYDQIAHTHKNSSKTTNVSVLKREKVCQETFNKNDYFRTGGNKIIEEMFHAWSNFEEKSLYSLEVTYWRSLSYLRTFSNRIMKASFAAPQKFFPLMAIFIKQQNV